MIYSIGHDIVENERISSILQKYPFRFIEKILSPTELAIYFTRHDKVRYLAKRFAAKEAFAKACKTGIRNPILFTAISVINNESGKPDFSFNEEIQQWLDIHQIKYAHLSLSDEVHLSSAFVVLEGN